MALPPPDRRLLAALLALVVLVALAPMHAGAAPGGGTRERGPGDALGEAQRGVEQAQSAVDATAAAMQAAVAEEARLGTEIARLEAEIPALRDEAEALREQVRARSAELYTGYDPMAVFEPVPSGHEIDGARGAHLTEAATRHDEELGAQLRTTADELQIAEADLRRRQEEQRAVIADLEKTVERLTLELFVVQVRLDRVNELALAAAAAGEAYLETGARLCPVQVPVAFTNDWGAPRSEGRTHKGTDIFAPPGTPNVAVVGGMVSDASGGNGGTAVYLDGDDGNRYYYAHLSAIVGPPRRVEAGEVVGRLGDTGNAAGSPHTHWQVHPGGGEPVNPFPTLTILCR